MLLKKCVTPLNHTSQEWKTEFSKLLYHILPFLRTHSCALKNKKKCYYTVLQETFHDQMEFKIMLAIPVHRPIFKANSLKKEI